MREIIPLPSPRWERLDRRGINSTRKAYAVISPSTAFILTKSSIHVNLEVFFTSDDELMKSELFDVEWFCKYHDILEEYINLAESLGVGEE